MKGATGSTEYEWRPRLVAGVRKGDLVRGHGPDLTYASEDRAFVAHERVPDGYGGVWIGDHSTGAYGLDETVLVRTKIAKLEPVRSPWARLP